MTRRNRLGTRIVAASALAVAVPLAGGWAAWARDDPPAPSSSSSATAAGPASPVARNAAKSATSAATAALAFTPEREAAALSFVNRHHPELAAILAKLKGRNLSAYQDAVIDLFRTSEALADQRVRDPKRQELALEAWKAKSRVEVLTAKLADPASRASLADELREALSHQIQVDIRKHQYELDALRARERKLQDQIHKLERERSQIVEAKVKKLVDRARKKKK